MKSIDEKVLAAYNAGIEKNRLRQGLGLIEFERTKELLHAYLPHPHAFEHKQTVIYDIGGGYGEYAYYLTALGYEVDLFDLSPTNIAMSHDLGQEHGFSLHCAEVADARHIGREDESADAILLLGPLYHIISAEERRLCLLECSRLLKPQGILFTAAITRYATTLWALTSYHKNQLLDDPAFYHMLEQEVKSGHHIPPENSRYQGMGQSYFHLPREFKSEVEEAGFQDMQVHGVVGPGWLAQNVDEVWGDPMKRESIMRIVRLCDKEDSIMGLSTHLLGVYRKDCHSRERTVTAKEVWEVF